LPFTALALAAVAAVSRAAPAVSGVGAAAAVSCASAAPRFTARPALALSGIGRAHECCRSGNHGCGYDECLDAHTCVASNTAASLNRRFSRKTV
jgi:hypothetical protein